MVSEIVDKIQENSMDGGAVSCVLSLESPDSACSLPMETTMGPHPVSCSLFTRLPFPTINWNTAKRKCPSLTLLPFPGLPITCLFPPACSISICNPPLSPWPPIDLLFQESSWPSCLFQGSFCQFHFLWWLCCFNVDLSIPAAFQRASESGHHLEWSKMLHL